ncbi:uncharacterized protein F4817DRAFT_317098 [Daldinia loculata]|uniref:uncharacterized protein n=1 Tax=Daldinia loculata TaxID=103429 RepID=UPI0020C2A339|nr:uncharacterized protein F4817DRAFT_317098 [Daldinia loculata]KAI1646157.1 hypothetical protein F4817DRAFT_317098 [Daldinia loculata]
MKVPKCLTLGVFSCLQGLSLASVQPQMFDNSICPWYYIRQNYHDSTEVYTMELIATCGVTVNSALEYHTSLLDLDRCFVNKDGNIKLATADMAPLGGFSKTCWSCGLMNIGPHNITPDTSKPIIACQCKPEQPSTDRSRDASFEFGELVVHITSSLVLKQSNMNTSILTSLLTTDQGIWIDPNGVIGCLDHTADIIPYSNSSTPKMIPPNLLAPPATITTTVTSTVVQNNTLTNTDMVTSNATVVSTATATATATVTATLFSTADPSCPSGSQATVTKTKRRRAKTVTKTVTTPSVSTYMVTVMVTPAPTGNVVATIKTETTAWASFTTVYPRP